MKGGLYGIAYLRFGIARFAHAHLARWLADHVDVVLFDEAAGTLLDAPLAEQMSREAYAGAEPIELLLGASAEPFSRTATFRIDDGAARKIARRHSRVKVPTANSALERRQLFQKINREK